MFMPIHMGKREEKQREKNQFFNCVLWSIKPAVKQKNDY